MADEPGSAGRFDLASFLTFRLTAEEWEGLTKRPSRLPPEARADVEDCVRRYMLERRWSFAQGNEIEPDAEARILHRSAAERRDARKRLGEKIRDVLEDSEWPTGHMDPVENARIRFVTFLLGRWAVELGRAGGPDTSRPGPKSPEAAHRLIADLARVFEKHTGEPATRSCNAGGFVSFAEELCKIFEPTITRNTIESALRKSKKPA
jgi:hypothetical protein